MTKDVLVALTQGERELVERVARREGITVEQAASELVHEGISQRVRKNTGHGPARLYQLPMKTND